MQPIGRRFDPGQVHLERTAFFIPGSKGDAEKAIRECTAQNGGVLVGNPTIQKDLTAITVDDALVTVIIVEDEADRHGWWADWARVHGYKSGRRSN